MRLTQILNRQHLGFMFKKHWQVQGKRVARETGAHAELLARGVTIKDPLEYIKPNTEIDIPENLEEITSKVNPEFHFSDNDVLLEGLVQAQNLLKCVHVDHLPSNIMDLSERVKIPENLNQAIKDSILVANVFDAEQEKLEKIKDPLRPAYVFPRVYGITNHRRMKLLISKLLQQCEFMTGTQLSLQRKIINDACVSVPLIIEGNKIYFEAKLETMISSKKPIHTIENNLNYDSLSIPSIFPLNPTISIRLSQDYKNEILYPIKLSSKYVHPHTIFLHYSKLDVKNLTEIPVNETQRDSRNLIKAFAVAASRAISLYGEDVKELPEPITVQSIQTDGQTFDFGILQLRNLNLNDKDGVKNVWHTHPKINLYSECCYKDAIPVLSDYNDQVFKLVSAFYNNE